MRKHILFLTLLLWSALAFGQSDLKEKIESRKIAMITKELELTPDQAERFWPIYREFDNKRASIQREFIERRRSFDPKTASDEETRKMIDMGLQVKEQQLGLEREYSDRLRQVISDRQLINLRRAEDEFKQMLLERVRQRRQQMQRSREQNERQKNRRRNN